jgi:Aerobic-type carbon monoxide dehydrogenase, large subunit CoxL/CutL homologs
MDRMPPEQSETGVGSRVSRNEDGRVLAGDSVGTDDIPLTDAVHIQFIRSEHAHASFQIDAAEAVSHPEVVDVFTASDIEESATSPRTVSLYAAHGGC